MRCVAASHLFSGICALIKRADRDAKRLTAGVALVEARTMGFTLHERGLVDDAAVRADAAFRPDPSLKPFADFGFVLEDRIGKVAHGIPYEQNLHLGVYYVKVIIP